MIERYLCPFCGQVLVENEIGAVDRDHIEATIRAHLELRHPIRRRLYPKWRKAYEQSIRKLAGREEELDDGDHIMGGPTFDDAMVGARGPNGESYGGPTGAVPLIEHVEAKGKPDEIHTGYGTIVGVTGTRPGFVGFKDGEWYAFRLLRLRADDEPEEFFASAHPDGLTGFLELREIPDPWLCWKCGLGYQEGAHTEFGFTGPDAHDYVARGAPAE